MKDIKRFTKGALLVSMVHVFLLINLQMGNLLETILYWGISIPFIIYTREYGMKAAILPSLTSIILAIFYVYPTTIFYLISAIALGVFYGRNIDRMSRSRFLFLFWIFNFIISCFDMLLLAKLFGYELSEYTEFLSAISILFHYQGKITSFLLYFFIISMIFIYSVFQMLCIHLLTIQITKRLPVEKIQIYAFSFYKWYKTIIHFAFVICLCLFMESMIKLDKEISFMLDLISFLICSALVYMNLLYSMILFKKNRYQAYVWIIINLLCFLLPIGRYFVVMISVVNLKRS